MNEANRDQVELWNRLGKRWVTYRESLDRVWKPLGDTTIEHAAIMPGERVIDVGCGCGATALELAARVGPSGFVVGIDVSQPMLKRARERARAAGVANI
ncbi:MAG: methyltransferase domain-containing protein [Deltaproteobacteria bacterium]|nr:methyltransferase domain-containing protein [Deltaproteobacteria bacterium]